jgi:hypothetical protein
VFALDFLGVLLPDLMPLGSAAGRCARHSVAAAPVPLLALPGLAMADDIL